MDFETPHDGAPGGELFAVSRRCRHQLADLSEGSADVVVERRR